MQVRETNWGRCHEYCIFFVTFLCLRTRQADPVIHQAHAGLAVAGDQAVQAFSCMLGHYSAGFTLNTYCHATRDMQADAARKIGGFMSAQTGIG